MPIGILHTKNRVFPLLRISHGNTFAPARVYFPLIAILTVTNTHNHTFYAMQKQIEDKLSLFQVVIIVLSLYVLLSLVVSTFFKLDPEVQKLLEWVDNAICIVFLADFAARYRKAPDKWQFMKWGWIDLVSSIPALDYFRAGRLLRLIRLLRVLRAFRSTKVLLNYVFRQKTHGAFTTAIIIAILMLVFSSIAILQVEDPTDSGTTIRSAGDALWWAFTTITTVGYGDTYPKTGEGRVIAVILMTVGVGLFGTFTAFLASIFVEDRKAPVTNGSMTRPDDIY